MNDAIKRALERIETATGKADREAEAQRKEAFEATGPDPYQDACERAERCEGQAHGLRAASRMLEEELAKVGVKLS